MKFVTEDKPKCNGFCGAKIREESKESPQKNLNKNESLLLE